MLTRLVIQGKRLTEAGDAPARVLAFVSPTDAEKQALGQTAVQGLIDRRGARRQAAPR
jgi:hypothetical protein